MHLVVTGHERVQVSTTETTDFTSGEPVVEEPWVSLSISEDFTISGTKGDVLALAEQMQIAVGSVS